ncbi:MAG: acyltransferase family protein [Ilumatobacteraceae bacterium]
MLRATAAPQAAARDFGYQPALDGVRAVAVTLVLLFHQGWLQGGYVGVSVFFTLSGYLITSLALDEHERTGAFDVPAFFGRRIRRLLPASLACLVGIVVLAVLGLFDGVEHLRRDLFGALFQVSNWVALGSGQSYADLVGGPGAHSPVEHYWSLAIEEQFYWVWPVVMVAVLRRAHRRRVAIVGVMTLGAAVAAPLIAAIWGGDAAYWATPARLGEILVGALLAIALHGRRRDLRMPSSVRWLAVLGGGVIVWAATTWPSGSGPAYRGWLPVFALASAAVVLGLQVGSPMRVVLARPPLVALGAISYGVYLIHWPVYVVLDVRRTGLGPGPLFVLRIVVTLGLAIALYRSVEQPIRRGHVRAAHRGPAALAACAGTALIICAVPVDTTPYWMRGDDATSGAGTLASVDSVGELRALAPASIAPGATTTVTATVPTTTGAPATTVAPTTVQTTVAPTTVAPPSTSVVPVVPPLPTGLTRPVRILVVGDSTGWATGDGMKVWANGHSDVARVGVTAGMGTGFLREGTVVADSDDTFKDFGVEFREERVPQAVQDLDPDVVVGMVTLRDLDARLWDDAEGPLVPTDDRFVAHLVEDYDIATNQFLQAGASDVLWVLGPPPDVPPGAEAVDLLDPVRYQRYAEAMFEVAARHPGQAAVVDMRTWMAAQPDPPTRPDGLHFDDVGALDVAERFLGPIAVNAALT